MPLHNLERSANAVPHIRYMAGTASWMLSTDEGMQTINLPQCLFDFSKIKTGWGCFMENEAPEWVWDPSLEQQSLKPNDGREWKKGFHILVLLPQEYAPFQLRELATTSVGAVEGIKGLYAQYEEGLAGNPGKVPLVQFVGATPTQIGRKGGRTNIPSFQITGWVDRPPMFDEPLGGEETGGGQQQFTASQSGFAQPTPQTADQSGFQAAPQPVQQQQAQPNFGDNAPAPAPSQAATSVPPPQDNPSQSAPPQQDSGSLNKPVF